MPSLFTSVKFQNMPSSDSGSLDWELQTPPALKLCSHWESTAALMLVLMLGRLIMIVTVLVTFTPSVSVSIDGIIDTCKGSYTHSRASILVSTLILTLTLGVKRP